MDKELIQTHRGEKIFMATSKIKGSGHNEHRYLHFMIMHEDALNVHSEIDKQQTNINRTVTKTTWDRIRKPFLWSITRPETGQQKFSRSCAYCKEKLEIQVISLQEIISLQKRDRILKTASLIAMPILIIVIVACFATQKYMSVGAFSIFGLLVSLLLAISPPSAGVDPGYWEEIGLKPAYWRQKGPFKGHYIETVESFSEESGGQRSDTGAVHIGPVKLKTVGDFLKLIGMRVEFTTKQDESFEATVRDLSDSGTHILLDDVLRIEHSKVPGEKIVLIARRDLVDTGDLSQYKGKRMRLRMKPVGFVQGILHGTPKTTEHLELTMVTYYHPCEINTILIDDLTFVEVMDRSEILF
jgi:hypothetical protein